jgi:hypothetical protein
VPIASANEHPRVLGHVGIPQARHLFDRQHSLAPLTLRQSQEGIGRSNSSLFHAQLTAALAAPRARLMVPAA